MTLRYFKTHYLQLTYLALFKGCQQAPGRLEYSEYRYL